MSALPRPTFPVYDIVIPSLKKKVKFRPYVSREEKVLSIAQESGDINEIGNAIKMVLQNCIQTKDIDVDKLSTFDIEFLWINIRAKAVGEEIELNVLYPSDDDEEIYVPVLININDIKIQETEGHSNVIEIDDDLKMIMKYPTFDYFIQENFKMPESDKDKIEMGFDLITTCVDKICKGEDVWTAVDVGKEEVMNFLDDLTTKQFEKIQFFLDTMPRLEHKIKLKHPKNTITIVNDKGENENTPEEKEVTLSGILDFFM